MAYTLSKSNGSTLLVLSDGVVDQSVTSINLIGKNVSNFGDAQNENFLHLLENFATNIQPRSPIQGQIWFDTTDNILRPMVHDGTNWRPLAVSVYHTTATDVLSNAGGANIAACRPGDFWFDSNRKQLHVVTSGTTTATQTVMIGPEGVPGFGTTKLTSTVMRDTLSITHPVIQMVLDGEVIGVLSGNAFSTDATGATLGFPRVYRGLTLKNYSTSTVQSTSANDVTLHGILDHLDSSYTRRNNNEHIQSNWSVDSGYSLKFGSASQSNISWNTALTGLSVESSGSIKLQSVTTSLTFNGSNLVSSDNSVSVGSSTTPFDTGYFSKLSSGSELAYGTIEGSWHVGSASKVASAFDLESNLGDLTHRFGSVFAKNINGGAGTSSIVGTWQLDATSSFSPETDLSNSLGSGSKRFSTVYTKALSASTTSETISVTGNLELNGGLIPKATDSLNVGSTSTRWNNVYAKNVVADSESVINLNATVVNSTNITAGAASISTATIAKIIDSFANAITKFDTDVSLAANENGFVSTQRAVKTYVDNTKDYIVGLIGSVQADLANQISNIRTVPAGSVFYVAMLDVPVGYLVCNGASLSTTSYPSLFAAIGYTYGGTGGTFNLPDLRGQFIRGWDAGRGLDPSRAFGSAQSDDFKSHKHGITLSHEQGGSHDQNGFPQTDWTGGMVHHSADQPDASWCYPNGAGNPMSSTGGAETRPKNVSLLPIIKT